MNSAVLTQNDNVVNVSSELGKPCYKREISPSLEKRIQTAQQIMSLRDSISSQETVFSSISKSTENYRIADLVKDWKSRDTEKCPSFWEMSETSDGLFFGYMGDVSSSITRSILVKSDMSVEVSQIKMFF